MIRRLLGLILSIIVAVILFILLLAFFPSRKKTVNVVNMRYVFVDSDGNEYDVFQKGHGAPEDWSFLFEKDYVGESDENSDIETGDITTGNNKTGSNETHNLNPDNPFNLPEGAIEKPLPKDCETPRGMKIRHKESILAYQQRSDVPDVCNVQRRTCNNGVLDGYFSQPACNEKVAYTYNNKTNNTNKETNNTVSYTKKAVISHNDVSKNELIQTPKYAKNEGAKFDTKGKLQTGEKAPKTDRDPNDSEREISEFESVEQTNKAYFNCISPRGEVVQHGQFVRAYDFPFGFTNASCNVELRLCVDGELKGNYTYNECQYLDVTYEEYNSLAELQAEEGIYGEHEITNKTKQGFWGWLKNLFK